MKKIIILLLFTALNTAFAQNGKVYLKSKFNVGKNNTYIYEPPQGVVIEDNAKANVLYVTSYDFSNDLISLKKDGKRYEFTTKVPDSARVLMVSIDDLHKIADNNKDQGYVVLLKTQNDIELGKSMMNQISMRNYANHFLNLKLDTKPENIIAEYDAVFAKYPKLREDKGAVNYLYLKKSLNAEQGQKDLMAFASKCIEKNTEEYLTLAYNVSQGGNKPEETEKLGKEISARYPTGQLERTFFIRNFYDQANKTEAAIKESMNAYKAKFKDFSPDDLRAFDRALQTAYLENGEYEKAVALEPNLKNASDLYNNYAWGKSGGDLTSPVKNLDFVVKISERSMYLLEQRKNESYYPGYNDSFNMFADTYALLLYKQGKYAEAFKYQSGVKDKNGLDSGGKDRYLGMMDKVKSKDEVKAYIDDEISKGNTSRVFLAKLKEIYIEKKLPLEEYNAIEQKTNVVAKENKNKDLIQRFGSANAIDFTLKNLDGKETKLSDYKGKVVVLDFWATWCGPCKASFPKMQNLVTKYKGKDVAFLFINTWENGKEEDIFKKVSSYIVDKKFDFNVVFDSKAEVVTNYKVNGIPTRVVIDKNGTILAYDYSNTDIAAIIDEQLK
ncbi:TlpA family protein disulfide reductase [Flavobacterium sp. 17A]|uniref:TlpA family protein disulfide reductase n=1 Tax=Flavobacterium potami TaxID=2872310 RepID=A0A9X1HD82_9FLAO|nr:redoxin domain-containing protein [Flavobacterium potami]MBZ4036995.1 TlpA family protein disulfide reductase [Flavobacterium potami]